MDESEELSELLRAFLAELRPAELTPRGRWLIEVINAEILRAEKIAALDWSIADSAGNDGRSGALSDADRLEIALRVTYHHLVAVPRMWAYVNRFWHTHGQVRVRLLDSVTNEPLELSWRTDNDTTVAAFNYISRFVDMLEEHYGLTIHQHGWLPSEGHLHGE